MGRAGEETDRTIHPGVEGAHQSYTGTKVSPVFLLYHLINIQEAARKKVEDTEKKVKEEAEKLVRCVFVLHQIILIRWMLFLKAQQRKEEHDRRVQEAVEKIVNGSCCI